MSTVTLKHPEVNRDRDRFLPEQSLINSESIGIVMALVLAAMLLFMLLFSVASADLNHNYLHIPRNIVRDSAGLT